MDSAVWASPKPELPCAACRTLHRKCSRDCTLALYFPAGEPEKFASVHKVFGASNVIKMLQMVDQEKREDAVKSMVYEANERLRDPVHGCTNAISYLQKCIQDLQLQLKRTREQLQEIQEHSNHLLTVLMDVPYQNPVYQL
ncbi:LOB domain-containing protein 4-like [Typha angustifolia]|uniref:LOB domain-containing protein 4-like n=1 Tax=Typha angustifolia TaxID=59011 RepID=UPI003C2C42E9